MDGGLNTISMLGSFLLVFGLLFFIQRYTIGLIPIFHKQIGKFAIGDLLFITTSLLLILFFVDFLNPN